LAVAGACNRGKGAEESSPWIIKNGVQVVRLFQSPTDLFVIQSVGNIKHAHGETARLRMQGKEAHFVTIDGQHTARLLTAYCKLTPHTAGLPAALPSPPSS
jgi:hypothetical protein